MTQGKSFAEFTLQVLEQMLASEDLETTAAISAGMNIMAKLLGAEAGAAWIRDQKDGSLRIMVNQGPMDLTDVVLGAGEGIEGRTVAEGVSRIVSDGVSRVVSDGVSRVVTDGASRTVSDGASRTVADGASQAIADGASRIVAEGEAKVEKCAFEARGLAVRNLICVPMKKDSAVYGCLILVNLEGDREDQAKALTLCERVAALSALLIDEKGSGLADRKPREVLIQARGVVKEYPSGTEKVRILKGIDLDIYQGEFVVILGESGCGKSTLVNIIAGMDNLTEGTLTVGGKDFSHPSDQELTNFRRKAIGFVFQNYHLMPNLTALENVQFVADLVPGAMPASEALELVGLAERANHFPSMLSGGQQQRVSIARAVVKQPKLIFADEPTAALDYQTSIEVLSVFEQVVRSRHTTVVMITHNPEIARMADRVIRLQDGRITDVRVNPQPARAQDLTW